MTQQEFTNEFKAHARSVGMDIIGIAPIERFNDLPKEKHPSSIFPEARSVVVVGKRIVRGVLRGVEEGTQFGIYDLFGRDWLNNRPLALATFKTAEFLEDNGWEAVPMPYLPPETPAMGVPVKKDRPAPNIMVDFNDAAVRAGVGEIGYCGFLLTPAFGPRQRLQMILTDADLVPDDILKDPICTGCMKHAASVCPLGAISSESEQTLRICGKEMVVGAIDYGKCARCKNGATPNPWHPAGKPERLAAACARGCVAELEDKERLTNKFENKFRKRAPWGVIEERRML